MKGQAIENLAVCVLVAFAASAAASDAELEPEAKGSEVGAEAATGEELEPSGAAKPGEGAPAQAAEGISGWVERAAFTTAVVEREPADALESLTNDHVEIFFFTELRELQGQTVTHRWQYRGEVVAEVPFAIGGPRWRTHSSKKLDPAALGEWTVAVVDGSGHVLQTRSFQYREAGASEPQQAAPADSEPTAVPPAAPEP